MKVNHIKKRLPPYNDKSSLSIPSRQNLPVYKNKNHVTKTLHSGKGNDSNLLIVFYVQIMPDDFV
ncbi:hypothetical protein, partial [Escherichia coli]|uniref:hypothetical protein n=1 Tax=Escherichia coli TaxID=562 RepID=UPI0031B5CAE5